MEKKTVTVKILGKTREYPMGITYAEIVKEYEGATKYPIVLVMKDGKLRELHKRLKQQGLFVSDIKPAAGLFILFFYNRT